MTEARAQGRSSELLSPDRAGVGGRGTESCRSRPLGRARELPRVRLQTRAAYDAPLRLASPVLLRARKPAFARVTLPAVGPRPIASAAALSTQARQPAECRRGWC